MIKDFYTNIVLEVHQYLQLLFYGICIICGAVQFLWFVKTIQQKNEIMYTLLYGKLICSYPYLKVIFITNI